jgi:hypothetical protein
LRGAHREEKNITRMERVRIAKMVDEWREGTGSVMRRRRKNGRMIDKGGRENV